MKHYPQYVHIKKYNPESRGQTPNPDIEPMPKNNNNDDKKLKKLDINDLMAAIMVRIRKNEANFPTRSSPTQETSFYYKESSISSHEVHRHQDVAVQVHKEHSNTSTTSNSSNSSENSYAASRISQQVFVDPKQVKHQYDIKNKVASFFSSVSKYKTSNYGNTKL